MFDLGVLIEGIHGHVFTYAALLVATMWHLRGEREVIVDPYGAKLQHLAGVHGPEDVGSPDGSGQAVDHVVGFAQHLFLSAEADDDDNRAEDLIRHDLSIAVVWRDHGWFKAEAFLPTRDVGALAPYPAMCA